MTEPTEMKIVKKQPILTLHEIERRVIQTAVLDCNGNIGEAAKALGIGKSTLYRKLKEYDAEAAAAAAEANPL